MFDSISLGGIMFAGGAALAAAVFVIGWSFGLGLGRKRAEQRFQFERQNLIAEISVRESTFQELSDTKNAHIQALEDEIDEFRAKYIRPRNEHGEFVKQ